MHNSISLVPSKKNRYILARILELNLLNTKDKVDVGIKVSRNTPDVIEVSTAIVYVFKDTLLQTGNGARLRVISEVRSLTLNFAYFA